MVGMKAIRKHVQTREKYATCCKGEKAKVYSGVKLDGYGDSSVENLPSCSAIIISWQVLLQKIKLFAFQPNRFDLASCTLFLFGMWYAL